MQCMQHLSDGEMPPVAGNGLLYHPNAHTMQLDGLILLLFEIYAIRKYQLFLINFGFLGLQGFI